MHKIRNALSLLFAISALAALTAAPADAQTLRLGSESGQPVASGQVEGLDAHGAIHCQALVEYAIGASKGEVPGVVVITPNGAHLGGPKGGFCALIASVYE